MPRTHSKTAGALMLVALVAPSLMSTVALAQPKGIGSSPTYSDKVDCSGLKLKDATGVPSAGKHGYVLVGICRSWLTGPLGTMGKEVKAFMTLQAAWDQKANTFSEAAKLEGGVSGKVQTQFKCSSDPYLGNSSPVSSFGNAFSGNAPCIRISHTNTTPWPGLTVNPNKGWPIGLGHVNADEAAKLSLAHSSEALAKIMKSKSHKQPGPLKRPQIGGIVNDDDDCPPKSGSGGAASIGGGPPMPCPPAGPKPPKKPAGLKSTAHPAMEYGVDRLGGDYRGFPLAQPQAALCRQACLGEQLCRAWTFVSPGIKGPQAMCFLKNTVPPKRPDRCCISGVK